MKIPHKMNTGEKWYDSSVALFLCNLADNAYMEKNELPNAAQAWGALKIDMISSGDTQVLAVLYESFVVLAFRGTEVDEIGDILTDLQFRKKPLQIVGINQSTTDFSTEDMKVHTGFEKAFGDVHMDLHTWLQQHAGERTIYVTGHSLGAALATLFVYFHPERNCVVYSFGSPRVGNKAFARQMDEDCPHYRIVNAIDPVTMVPFLSWNYRHTGKLIYFTGRGRQVQNPPWHMVVVDQIFTSVKACFNGGFNRWLPLRVIKSHSIDSYRSSLRRSVR